MSLVLTPPPFEFELRRRNVRTYAAGLLTAGLLTGGSARGIQPPVTNVAAAGANMFAEAAEFDTTPTSWGDFWGAPWIVSAILTVTGSAGPVDPNARAGIEIGSSNTAADPAAPVFGLIRLYADLWQGVWTLYTAPGGGGASATLVLAPFFGGVGNSDKLTLAYSPGRVQAYINGVSAADVTATAPIAGRARTFAVGAGVFCGTSANAGDVTTASFTNVTVETIGRV
jgi:hypothetical protein